MEIATIIVTYNRLDLLKKCIQAVKNQTQNSDIIIVNNGSTDETEDWLKTQKDLIIITQTNQGGAGGFHRGIHYAYEKGYKWFWIMDDDGLPMSTCLEKLYNVRKLGFHYIAPNLIDYKGEKHFPQFDNVTFSSIVNHCGGPFNAILISNVIVEKIGLPNKLFFIWGDEYEYINRIKNEGFFVSLCLDAIHIHKRTEIDGIPSNRLIYKYRNQIWISRLNKNTGKVGILTSLIIVLKNLLREIITLRLYRAFLISRAIKEGFCINYNSLKEGGNLKNEI